MRSSTEILKDTISALEPLLSLMALLKQSRDK